MKKGFLYWFKNQKLGKKILYAFIFSAIVPILIVQGVMLYLISNNLKDKMDELMVSQLTQMGERANLTLNIYMNLVYQAYVDNQIIINVEKLMDPENNDKEVAYREIFSCLQQYSSSAEGIQCISIICSDGNQVTYDFERASSVESIWKDYSDFREIDPYKKAQESYGMAITPTMRFVDNKMEYRMFHISKKMYDFENLEKGPIATIVMSVDENVLNKICTMDGKDVTLEEYSVNFITDEDGNVMTYPDSFYSGISMNPEMSVEKFVQATGKLKNKNIAVNEYRDQESGWTFYNVYDKDYMLWEVTQTQRVSLLIGFIITAVSVILIIYTVKLVEHSIKEIINGIQEVQRGNLNIKVSVDSADEVGQIAENFNTMTGKVQKLIEEVTDATQKQKEAEIRALEAQINPHFLYNTLDSINWMAIDKEEYEISKMIRNLGIILRYSINKSNQMVTIKELSDWLEKYVSLQQMRFNQSFSFQLRVDVKANRTRVFKLLLQPFVENAILHGFKGVERGGIIRIDILFSEEEQMLTIIIEDNGKGMPQDVVQKYNDKKSAVQDDGRSIGLHNAFSRMLMYYGEHAFWNVSSIPEVGTIITLKIPAAEGVENEDCNC